MRNAHQDGGACCCCRRDFLQAMGAAAGSVAFLSPGALAGAVSAEGGAPPKRPARVRGAFLYPPAQQLRDAGYWSWPGSTFDAEGHHKQYVDRIKAMERELGMCIDMDAKPLDAEESIVRFIGQVRQSPPDGLLLIPFKKGHWPHVNRIIAETKLPAVVLATLGVLLSDQIRQLHSSPGVYLISAMDDLDAVRDGMQMIRTAHRLRESRLINIVGSEAREQTVPHLGTQVRTLPLERFYAEYARTEVTDDVRRLADAYHRGAQEIVEPSRDDILDAAKACFALKRLVADEHADALMMDCLPGLQRPHRHVPPCMGFMTLRDEGIPAGCQADLNPTLTMMLVQELFGKPGFQQNAAMQTQDNRYFGAHCTSPSRMNGADAPAEPYILRNHAEAGWGCVPQVLFPEGQAVTMALYRSGESPTMLIYSGNVVRCHPKAAGGCLTNFEMTVAEVDDVCDVQGMHQIVFYGNGSKQLRRFCQLYGIEAVS